MRLFVCEYLTGGGMRRDTLPPHLLRDARLMLDALAADLWSIDGLETIMTRDDRLPAVPGAIPVTADTDVDTLWQRCLQQCEAAWIIAPETGGLLQYLHGLAAAAGCAWIGCDAASIDIAASKLRTAQHLEAAGIACIPTVAADAAPPAGDGGWVIKPDDGAGCEETRYLAGAAAVADWRRHNDTAGRVLQPRVEGIHASLSVLYADQGCELLACNRQNVTVADGLVRHGGVTAGALDGRRAELQPLAAAVGRALPGLRGYVGIDVILTDAGPVLVEINPRLTTAYAGLAAVLGCNPAEKILRASGFLQEPAGSPLVVSRES